MRSLCDLPVLALLDVVALLAANFPRSLHFFELVRPDALHFESQVVLLLVKLDCNQLARLLEVQVERLLRQSVLTKHSADFSAFYFTPIAVL